MIWRLWSWAAANKEKWEKVKYGVDNDDDSDDDDVGDARRTSRPVREETGSRWEADRRTGGWEGPLEQRRRVAERHLQQPDGRRAHRVRLSRLPRRLHVGLPRRPDRLLGRQGQAQVATISLLNQLTTREFKN